MRLVSRGGGDGDDGCDNDNCMVLMAVVRVYAG